MDNLQSDKNKKPLILITNDDGIDSQGIFALVNALKEIGDVFVAAPDKQQSAVGHALTVSQPLRISKFKKNGQFFGYAVNGTPSDCVKLAVSALLERKPDLIISGINHGQNTSVNILYSGTVSAATEGMLLGIPSIAVSLASFHPDADCNVAADLTLKIVKKILADSLSADILLNINVPAIPAEEIKGIKITHTSQSKWTDRYEKRLDPFGRQYFWFCGEYHFDETDEDADDTAIKNGYLSVTPIHYSFTDLSKIDKFAYLTY